MAFRYPQFSVFFCCCLQLALAGCGGSTSSASRGPDEGGEIAENDVIKAISAGETWLIDAGPLKGVSIYLSDDAVDGEVLLTAVPVSGNDRAIELICDERLKGTATITFPAKFTTDLTKNQLRQVRVVVTTASADRTVLSDSLFTVQTDGSVVATISTWGIVAIELIDPEVEVEEEEEEETLDPAELHLAMIADDGTNDFVRVATRYGSDWLTEDAVSAATGTLAEQVYLALDSSDNIRINYSTVSGGAPDQVYEAYIDSDDEWATGLVVNAAPTDTAVRVGDLAFDSGDYAWMLYNTYDSVGSENEGYLRSDENDVDHTAWEFADTDSDYNAAIAVDSADDVHVVFVQGTEILYNRFSGGSWQNGSGTNLHSCAVAGARVDIAVDTSNNPHIAIVCSKTASVCSLYYEADTGGGFSGTEVDVVDNTAACPSGSLANDNDNSWRPSIKVDGSDVTHIAYRDIENENLFYADNEGGWVVSDLTNAGSTGAFPTIVMDNNDKCNIAYIDGFGTSNIVKVITSTNSGWTTPATIDNSGDVVSISELAPLQ